MDSEEARKKLNDLRDEREILQKQLDYNNKRQRELDDVINRSAIFDETIVLYISQLLSYEEDKEMFLPFTYYKNKIFFGKKIRESCVCIGSCDKIVDLMRNNNEDFFQLKNGYKIFNKATVMAKDFSEEKNIGYYNYESDEKKRDKIIFEFLLNDYNVENLYPTVVFPVSQYNFEDYEYVQDYIRYLFNIQITNGGKQLSSDEMKVALDNYISLNSKDKKVLAK